MKYRGAWGVRLGSDKAEHPIGMMRRAGPNFLAVDYPLITIQFGFGGQGSPDHPRRQARNNPGTRSFQREWWVR